MNLLTVHGCISPRLGSRTQWARPLRLTAGACIFVAGIVCACSGPRPPCFGLSVGSKLSITIGAEQQDNDGTTTMCGYTFDVTQNEVLLATVVDTAAAADSDCTVGVAQFGPVNGWTWSDGHPGAGQGDPYILGGEYIATRGSCQGSLQLLLEGQGPNPLQTGDAGGPPAVFTREFESPSSSSPDCPIACVDSYFVTIERL
jgi:hypothetical protein